MSHNKLPEVSLNGGDTEILGYGCIEDRQPIELDGDAIETNQVLEQVPGADAFFSSAADVIAEANIPGSVEHSLVDTVERHILINPDYEVHNDDAHGEQYDGCGFLAKQAEIYGYLGDNIEEIFPQTQLPVGILDRAKALAGAASRLASNPNYFKTSGGELVEHAVNEFSAHLITYTGNHTASTLIIDEREGYTYDPVIANNESWEAQTTFNLDADIHLIAEAEKYGIDGEDAIIFAEIVSIATIRVLGADGEVTVISVSDDA